MVRLWPAVRITRLPPARALTWTATTEPCDLKTRPIRTPPVVLTERSSCWHGGAVSTSAAAPESRRTRATDMA